MNTTPKGILDTWVRGINRGDVDGVLGLYAPHAVLIPTFSNKMINTPELLREYFEKLGSREQLSVELHERKTMEQELGGSLWSLSGLYCWKFAVDDELLSFEARFSYVVDTSLHAPILHHHSSQIPRMLS
ncbi:DUF4440 domain-containing protein [Prosthecochloris sp. N3]|uniref:DUF4440 domain-containing protein n=1 Tax=Prosthecochloris ethylica TaxID=2743976 RepID=A0ABR9XTJ5_9CHLB|nr:MULTISPECIES: nuclear transport factor 2 family protein [Prosthecochloris]MEC9487502.1 nuclear transport factor 2 family protein [Prosthecochloris sp.]MBF0587048.1 DUF4440 domain-containing protein [Prosthecochloris ethylica]MBF0637326.1 DUF4440 domain-containing protein [Prosthecochloris ethylica]NUK48112.1 DUF4440 domain-containing protein [Prosthecochloris ethylica]RNA65311.1 DUF4440 domain-containing protein [Prosthecochloris sp. ZM_2]